jgi:hypothetical protein
MVAAASGRGTFATLVDRLGRPVLSLSVVGFVCQTAGVLLLLWLGLKKDLHLLRPALVAIGLGFMSFGAAIALLWAALRRSRRPPSPRIANLRQRIFAIGLMGLSGWLAIAGYAAIAYRLDGTRRLVLATVPILLGGAVDQLGIMWLRALQERPGPSVLGLAPRTESILFLLVALGGALLLLYVGLFVPLPSG